MSTAFAVRALAVVFTHPRFSPYEPLPTADSKLISQEHSISTRMWIETLRMSTPT